MYEFSRMRWTQSFRIGRSFSSSSWKAPSTSNAPKGLFQRVWSLYNHGLEKYPLATKSLTAGVLSFGADIVCQMNFPSTKSNEDDYEFGESSEGRSDIDHISSNDEVKVSVVGNGESNNPVATNFDILSNIDWARVGQFTLIGTALIGPVLHHWYGFLAKRLPGAGLLVVTQRLAIDQLLFAPLFIPTIFSFALLLEGKANEIQAKLKADWFNTVMANYILWVPAQFINFRFFPLMYQTLFSNSVGFFWNIFLSWKTYNTSNGSDNAQKKNGSSSSSSSQHKIESKNSN